jgi:hypothetical protein
LQAIKLSEDFETCFLQRTYPVFYIIESLNKDNKTMKKIFV